MSIQGSTNTVCLLALSSKGGIVSINLIINAILPSHFQRDSTKTFMQSAPRDFLPFVLDLSMHEKSVAKVFQLL